MNVYLARKDGVVINHTDLSAMKQLDGIDTPEKIVTIAEWEDAGGLARVIGGQIVIGKTQAELNIEVEITNLNSEQAALRQELATKDYKVVKAAESGLVLAQSDPDLHTRREWCRNRINEIETRLAELGVVD